VPSAAIKLALKVHNVEYLGSEWIVYARPQGERAPDKIVIARLPGGGDFELGSVHDFGVAEKHLRFFDKKTEKRAPARALAWP
jgi:hypothetical protein